MSICFDYWKLIGPGKKTPLFAKTQKNDFLNPANGSLERGCWVYSLSISFYVFLGRLFVLVLVSSALCCEYLVFSKFIWVILGSIVSPKYSSIL
ncbi:hypothetical protein RhiirA5_438451 [Rhizophagus irregularis]|uniref:Uncharacterized protein n=1 Tax=Rhizophagus irregularis TaxID=588596 RepID=A0A2N0NJ52_9GLOM|nr:hypothetical protein RhiirA5_438451 [Rhizophagus irregularis]